MNKNLFIFFILLFSAGICLNVNGQAKQHIVIGTKSVNLIFSVGKDGKLYQTYLGEKLTNPGDTALLKPSKHEAYIGAGTNNLFEPAIKVLHADGNPSIDLRFSSLTTSENEGKTSTTDITLKDPKYPIFVILHIQSFYDDDIIKTWTEIRHHEKKPVVLYNFASSMLHFDADKYWLTQFHGDWAEEAKMQESQLTSGIKIIDSKLGTRANMYQSPFFFLSLNKLADENTGELIAGTLAWTGNFKFLFELDERNSLRIVSGMNPFASEYKLEPGKSFTTPEFIFTYSNKGKGKASRSFHSWGRNYGILDGNKPRLTLLNNWEATYFDFNQQKLGSLFTDAKKLGVDLFLLDDGWFGNKYPRNNDNAGLGDWQENKLKLPDGISSLVKDAESKGVKFGVWLEPEMVNPKSELYEEHPDWILKLPNRDENYYRNQLVLDLINPKVQDFVYDLVDGMLTKSPGIAYIKWDCNRMMTNAYSPYLKDNQSAMYIEYTRSLYKVLERIRLKYPSLPMMLCSGGGGRTDYGALKYFNEFWPSDDTDGFERVYIQWGYSYFFPSLALTSHVTSWGKQSIKFRTDVAMMGKLGFDIDLNHLKEEERIFCTEAVRNYKRLEELITKGEMYRLVSPYEQNRAVLMYVDDAKNKALLFVYNLHLRYGEEFNKVKLQGLDPQKQYKVVETNRYNGAKSSSQDNDKTYSGDYLMKIGLSVSTQTALTSAIFEINSVN
ncbi:alpha-galactosidase [Pedobacter frigoris]|uniref:alpha-galactosidase n=1 Tax=Pedobacter frigoris TaxID=2571272 RepID=UPI00292E9A4A|nr:alpha-galactosidase [Pedobacter frigoris]